MSARQNVGLEAAAQIECFVDLLQRELKRGAPEEFETTLRGILPRMHDLTSVLLSVLGRDDLRPTSELLAVVYGEAPDAEPAPDEQGAASPTAEGQSSVVIRKDMAVWCYRVVRDHLEQANALSMEIEGRLSEACNDRCGELPDNAPLTAWRLSQVLEDQLGSNRTLDALKEGLKLTSEEIHAAG